MSLLMLEGFDDGIIENGVPGKWTSRSITINLSYGRNGKGGRLSNSDNHLHQSVNAHQTVIAGAAMNREKHTDNLTGSAFMRFSGDSGATHHVYIVPAADGEIHVWVGGTEVAASSGLALATAVWYYVEAKVVLDDVSGSVVVKVDGSEVVNFSGDTRNGGTNNTLDFVRFGTQGSASSTTHRQVWVDDIYIANGAGTVNNDFLGDVKVETLLPNANGNYSQLVGSDGDSLDNYLLVDEAAPASADYVGSPTDGQKDTYGFANLSDNTRTIKGVQATMYAAKTDTGAKSARQLVRTGGVDHAGGDEVLSTTYTAEREVWEQNPGTTADWTGTEVDGAEFGFEVRP